MMTRTTLSVEFGGRVDELLTHMSLLGAALVLDEAGIRGVRLHWSDSAQPRGVLEFPGESAELLAAEVRGLARRLSDEAAWTRLAVDVGEPIPAAVFNARANKPVNETRWHELLRARHAGFATMQSPLEHRLARALGEQAWWFVGDKRFHVGVGASPWEMRTRNHGTQFLPDRFVPLAATVASWSDDKILDGLTGRRTDDAVGKNSSKSLTPTGFVAARATDNAVAFLALTALAALPLMHMPTGPSAAAAYHPARGSRRAMLLMPVMTTPCSPHRMRALLRSSWLIQATGDAAADEPAAPGEREAALAGLASLGAVAIALFPVMKTANINSPERFAMTGRLLPCHVR